ncbi:hypothetical protein JKP88DRAFT_221702 [Tribonema minus]|uniref:Uncharacterized protein n=1 Tax=Tribonema minus TaxID=303371 RepID=A0A835YYW7_9STRA|nr:hypothetical protein JKP88DRAFT_221702 [Tribonema minus]
MAPGPRSGYAILWALEDVAEFMARQEEDAHAGKRGGPSVPEHIGILLGESLLHTRLAFSKLTVERSVTVPHMYTHMLWWFMMTFLTTLGFYAGIGKEDKDDVMGQVWWVVGYIMVTLAFCGLFDVAMALKEPFGTDSSDIDPLVAVDRAVALHQGFLSAPSMPADKQPSSMAAYDMFHASKSPGSSTWQPARGPLHTATWVPQVSCELHEMLSCRLPHDDDPFAASGGSMA